VPLGKSTICGDSMPPDLCPFGLNPRTRNKVCVASGGAKYLSFNVIEISSGLRPDR
jgi:hypothetical protein